MCEPDQSLTPRLTNLLDKGDSEEVSACLDRLSGADTDTRKRAIQSVRDLAEERPTVCRGLATLLSTFLTDDDRAVRLTTAKLFVTLARSVPGAVVDAVDALAARLADDDEFYYVRARCAEALGYLALDHPDAVSDPELLAEFRVGLQFEEAEVKEKLAKALEYVALGDPGRLQHQVGRLADHLDDESELVRYHLTTVFIVVGCAHPDRLAEVRTQLEARLDDPNPYVRGRAAEAIGVAPDRGELAAELQRLRESDESFVADRARFAVSGDSADESLGTREGVRETTERALEAITTPETDGECRHCGCALPAGGPPTCPRCGAPR
jgi:HEAT repeat protein